MHKVGKRNEDSLRNLGLFSLEKRRLSGHPTGTFQYLKGPTGKTEGLFIRNCSDRTRRNGYKLKEVKFSLDQNQPKVFYVYIFLIDNMSVKHTYWHLTLREGNRNLHN